MIACEGIKAYYSLLEEETTRAYGVAAAAREKGYDPETKVEIALAADICDRVEGLVGPEGIAEAMREYMKGHDREETALKVCDWIIGGKFGCKDRNERAEQCIRTALALLTEGVVAAPIDGVAAASIEENPDGSDYLSVSFAGPIRSAGGTAQALAVLIAHYTSNLLGLSGYRPTDSEVERYVEEVALYHNAVSRLQYRATDDEVRLIVRNCPVCVNGDPTAEVEVDVYKDLKRIPTNRVRGGMCLVISEGIAQKARKVVAYAEKFGLDWGWLKSIIKGGDTEGVRELKPIDTYIKDVVAGRPIFAYPSRVGGFRLRYGKARNTGLMSKGLHPATMTVLGGFPAIGTQLKVERPGKGMTVVPVDTIGGPVVRLKSGEVLEVESAEQATDLDSDIAEILFTGDLLVSFGDFLHSNHPIIASPWVEEWWGLELKEKGVEAKAESFEEALEISERHGVPLHPKYTYNYHDATVEEMKKLIKWLDTGMENGPEKRTLEKLLVPHRLKGDYVYIEPEVKKVLATTLGGSGVETEDTMEFVNALSPVKIMPKAPIYVGARMGRPEKARERLMTPAPHVLFPVGNYGGATRSVLKASAQGSITVTITRYRCTKCGRLSMSRMCECGGRGELDYVCPRCGRKGRKCHACGTEGVAHDSRVVNLKEAMEQAIKKVGKPDPKLKGVKGLMSAHRIAEPLEKGILRSRHEVYLFKDGTIRFDSTNLPLTHFTPKEIGTSVEKLKEMGYSRDAKGGELLRDDQVIELFPQDVVPAERGGEYLFRVSRFVDELLQGLYGQEAYYNCRTPKDLVGQLVVGLAPHTSAGVLGRIIGFSKARGCYAHPYFHAACRRDCFAFGETLPVFNGREWRIVRIGELVESLLKEKEFHATEMGDQVVETRGYSTLSLNGNGEYELMPITAFSKHPMQDHVVTLELETGRKITTSGMHPFIDSKSTKTRAFQTTEALIPTRFNIAEKDVECLDLLDYADENTMVVGIGKKLKDCLEEGGVRKTADEIGMNKSTLYNYVMRDSVPVWLAHKLGIRIPKNVRLKEKWDTAVLPRKIRVGKDFMRLLGLYVAEGHSRKREGSCYQVDFAVTKEKPLVKGAINRVFGVGASEGKQRVTICSRLAYNLFIGLEAGTHAKNKRVPPVVFSLPMKKVAWFLQGYFEGDGGISKPSRGGSSPEVSCTSASKLLLRDIEFLLTRFGLLCSWQKDERKISVGKVAEFYKKKGKTFNWTCYKLRMHGATTKDFCEKIGFWWPGKKEKARRIMRGHSFKAKRVKLKEGSAIVAVRKRVTEKKPQSLYNFTVEKTHNAVVSGVTAKQCDGDEDAVMLLVDALINFSKWYLPSTRGGSMDAPLVLTLALDPSQVDDQVHEMDVAWEYPLEFYRTSHELRKPGAYRIELVGERLGEEGQYSGFGYTHGTGRLDNGVIQSMYTKLGSMPEKVKAQLELGRIIRAVDEKDEAERLLNSHFFRDIYGNLRAFGEQKFRCVDCNAKYRRVPLVGKCTKCGGKVILTIAEGSVRKYVEISKGIVEKYGLPEYMAQRLKLVESNIDSVFINDKSKQYNLADFF